METILRYVALWLAAILEKFGDPTLQAKLDGFNAKVAEAERREKEAAEAQRASEIAYQTSLSRREELDRLIETSQKLEDGAEQRLAESQQRVKALEIENQKAKETLDNLSDHDRVRADL